jgi:two-component system sensor histidine kinase YesM
MSRLFTRFLLSFLLIIVLIFVTVTSLISHKVKRSSAEIVTDLTAQIMQARGGEIGMWIAQRRSELQVLMETESFHALAFEERFERVKAFARRHDRDFESIGLWGDEGRVWVTNGKIIDIRDREYYLRITEGNLPYVVSSPILSLADSEKAIVVITVREGENLLNGAILLSWLSDIAAKVEIMGQKAWIMDDKGIIVAHPDPALVMGQSEPPLLDRSLIRILAPVPHSGGWLLGVDIPRERLFAQGNRLIRSIFIIILIMAGISLLLALYLAKTLVRPIQRLQGLMFRAERGDLDVHAPGRRSDEIGRLERSFNSMIDQLQTLMIQVGNQQSALRSKEMESMLNQIKPHFLYNTLDSIRWMADEAEQEEISHMIASLSRLFRISLSDGAELIPLDQELTHVESYLQIQRCRYDSSFTYEIRRDPASRPSNREPLVIKLLLQPLVENAIYHGIKQSGKAGRISIAISVRGNSLFMEVGDTGPGFSEDFLRDWERGIYRGYGLRNIQERLDLHFGSPYGLALTGGDCGRVRISHPLILEEDEGGRRR